MPANGNLLRAATADGKAHVSFVELFFDLVFVFAITQLSHGLLAHFNVDTLVKTALLLMAVWWVWIYTTWVTNWLDPDRVPVRLMLYALMLVGLFMSTSIPDAFGDKGMVFALAYVAMHMARCLFMLWAVKGHDPGNYRNFQRITSWLALAAIFWIAGGLAEGSLRLVLWCIALAIEYASPAAGFWTPGLGRSTTQDWQISGAHMAERCGLFVIIALGESLLLAGATFAKLPSAPAVIAAFITVFVTAVVMWWLYFNIGAMRASYDISHSDDPGHLARLGYTYLHLPIVAGIILMAVAGELVLAHPLGAAPFKVIACVYGGAALFIFGNLAFKWAMCSRPPLSHLAGLGVLVALFAATPAISPLFTALLAMAVLLAVAVWETLSLGGGGTQPDLASPKPGGQRKTGATHG